MEWDWGIAASRSEGPGPEPTQPGCTGIGDLVASRNVGGQSPPTGPSGPPTGPRPAVGNLLT